LGDVVESDEADMNYLMSILLDKITFLPFGYLMDLYRWDIFKGDIPKEKYQEHWDKLRLEYQVNKLRFPSIIFATL
jgi:peptidyl-dipeptidase A